MYVQTNITKDRDKERKARKLNPKASVEKRWDKGPQVAVVYKPIHCKQDDNILLSNFLNIFLDFIIS